MTSWTDFGSMPARATSSVTASLPSSSALSRAYCVPDLAKGVRTPRITATRGVYCHMRGYYRDVARGFSLSRSACWVRDRLKPALHGPPSAVGQASTIQSTRMTVAAPVLEANPLREGLEQERVPEASCLVIF